MRQLIGEWKFRGRTSVTNRLARIAVDALFARCSVVGIEVVTWAPTSNRRRRRRGYDQAEILARAVARTMRLPCRRLLVRIDDTPQTGRGRSDRLLRGPSFRARPRGTAGMCRAGVLVIDDVVTTGSTLRSAAQALTSAGYDHVVLLALARTPYGEPI